MNMKLTPSLTSQIRNSGGGPIEVVVELSGDVRAAVDRESDIPSMMAAFSTAAEPVKSRIAELGGNVTNEAWLNSTLLAHVPAEAMERLSEDPSIGLLDVSEAVGRD